MSFVEIARLVCFTIGLVLTTIGAICDLMAAIGLLRLGNFFLRMHAATVGIIGGAAVPLIGIALLALSIDPLNPLMLTLMGTCIATAFVIMVVAPIGTHALANAAYRAREPEPQPLLFDALEKRKSVENGGKT